MGHLGIPVSDLEASVTFYEQLGFDVAFRSIVNGNRVAVMKQNSVAFELYQTHFEAGASQLLRKTGSIDHFAISVSDIDQAYADITAKHIPVIEGICALPTWGHGIKYFLIQGPDAERIEFAQDL